MHALVRDRVAKGAVTTGNASKDHQRGRLSHSTPTRTPEKRDRPVLVDLGHSTVGVTPTTDAPTGLDPVSVFDQPLPTLAEFLVWEMMLWDNYHPAQTLFAQLQSAPNEREACQLLPGPPVRLPEWAAAIREARPLILTAQDYDQLAPSDIILVNSPEMGRPSKKRRG